MSQPDENSAVATRFVEENLRAEECINDGNFRGAARILIDITDKDTGNWRAYNNMGIISWMQKSWEDAYTMFLKSVTLKPDYADALINLFDAALKLRRIAAVLPVFEKGLQRNPDMAEIKIIAESIRAQGDAIYQSERALQIGTYNPKIEEANKLLEDGKMFASMEKYLDVLDNDGPDAEAFSGLGTISYYQKRYEDAFTLFLESLKLNPTSTENFMNLLDAAKACGKVEMAKKVFDVYRKELPSLEGIAATFDAV